jgi:hypothetical protein
MRVVVGSTLTIAATLLPITSSVVISSTGLETAMLAITAIVEAGAIRGTFLIIAATIATVIVTGLIAALLTIAAIIETWTIRGAFLIVAAMVATVVVTGLIAALLTVAAIIETWTIRGAFLIVAATIATVVVTGLTVFSFIIIVTRTIRALLRTLQPRSESFGPETAFIVVAVVIP